MKYIPSTGWESGVAELGRRLATELAAGKRVLWLTSGGSNIGASVQIMATLPPEEKYLLSVMPVDERFGPPGHPDSNWQQLIEAGFKAGQAHLLPVLKAGQSLKTAANHYNRLAEQAFKEADMVIAQLGIGPDGHLAGIIPNTVATEPTDRLVVGFEHSDYQRLTLTFAALRHIKAAYAFAFGEPKAATIRGLQKEDLPLSRQPSQILKELPEAYLYSDQLERP